MPVRFCERGVGDSEAACHGRLTTKLSGARPRYPNRSHFILKHRPSLTLNGNVAASPLQRKLERRGMRFYRGNEPRRVFQAQHYRMRRAPRITKTNARGRLADGAHAGDIVQRYLMLEVIVEIGHEDTERESLLDSELRRRYPN